LGPRPIPRVGPFDNPAKKQRMPHKKHRNAAVGRGRWIGGVTNIAGGSEWKEDWGSAVTGKKEKMLG